ncbi:MAG: hypothetical protein QOJ13_3169 [Gaiellales bacterium]|nr:hypothetical protein [Gaiellales bacterium]
MSIADGQPRAAPEPVGPAPPTLDFEVENVEAVPFTAAPTLGFRIRIDAAGAEIRSLALSAQIRIASTSRSYTPRDQARLVELFGAPEQWGQTLRSLLWTNASVMVPSFRETTTVDLHVACTYDYDVASAKYFQAIEEGDVPLEFLFAGTIFYTGERGLQAAHVPWDREAQFALPVAVWRKMMDRHFPGSHWMRLGNATFERLAEYRRGAGVPSWDAVIDQLLDERGQER